MLFNSWQYLLFLPIVFCLYWIIPNRHKWILLLSASYYFYMCWNAAYVILIFGTTAVTYLAALLIEKSTNVVERRFFLASSLLICLGVLFVFKYFNFTFEMFNLVAEKLSIKFNKITLQLLLPVGISFYTFQTLSYVIDVFEGKVPAEHHFGYYATFISFFPQLVAGPIERTSNLLPQIKQEHSFDGQLSMDGAKLMLIGYFKKMVVADNLAVYVDRIYNSVRERHGFALAAATILFAIQIYCDFSGYSDIARGTGKLLGIRLMENFKAPYLSGSIHEFWSRWHISLSSWLKDYVYIPLGGNRKGSIRKSLNLLVTFFASGLWHGANITFVVWGLIHGIFQLIENFFGLNKKNSRGPIRVIRTFVTLMIVCLAWVFFRAQSLDDACYVLIHMFDGITSPLVYIKNGLSELTMGITALITVTSFYLIPLLAIDLISYKENTDASMAMNSWNKVIQWIIYLFIACIIILYSRKGVATEFVYFQF